MVTIVALLLGATFAARHRSVPEPGPAERLDRYAVMPFTNRTGDARDDDLASQLTDETAARLVNKSWRISVINTKPVFTEEGANIDDAALGRKLDLDYLVKGSLQRSDGKLEASVALIDGKSGVLLFSGHADHAPADQAVLARWLAASVSIQVLAAVDADRQGRMAAKPALETEVPDLLDRAHFVLEQKPPHDWYEAIPLVDKAVAAAPTNAHALYLSGAVRADLVEMSAYRDEMERQNFVDIAERRLLEAERLAPDKPAVHVELGMLRDHQVMRDAARAEYQRAQDIDGASVSAHVQIALEELYGGHADTAMKLLDQALPASAPDCFLRLLQPGAGIRSPRPGRSGAGGDSPRGRRGTGGSLGGAVSDWHPAAGGPDRRGAPGHGRSSEALPAPHHRAAADAGREHQPVLSHPAGTAL